MEDENVLSEFLTSIERGHENILDVAREVLPDGKEQTTVAMQNRVLQPEQPAAPKRKESPKRRHEFHAVSGLVEYLKVHASDNLVVLANTQAGQVEAILDEKATTGFESVVLRPQTHPLFAPWKAMLDKKTVLLDIFVQSLLENRRTILKPDVRDLVITFSQVRAATSVTVEHGVGNKSLNGVMVETVIQNKKHNEYVDLPESITIEVPLYVDTGPSVITIDLLVGVVNDRVAVTLVSGDLAQAYVQTFEQICQECRGIGKGVVALGQGDWTNWDYVTRSLSNG